MIITEMNNISTLVLFASGACNLKCSYCHIHKNKSLIGIDKEIRDAWADGTYLKTTHHHESCTNYSGCAR